MTTITLPTTLADRLRACKAEIDAGRTRRIRARSGRTGDSLLSWDRLCDQEDRKDRDKIEDILAIIGDRTGLQLALFDAWLRDHLPERAHRISDNELQSALKVYRTGEIGSDVGILHRAVWDCTDHLDGPAEPRDDEPT